MRWKFGPSFGVLTFAKTPPPDTGAPTSPAPPPPPAKKDIEVEALGVDDTGVGIRIPAYDLAECNKLVELRVYAISEGSILPTEGNELAAQAHPFGSLDVSAIQGGSDVRVPLPDVPDGSYLVPVLLGFES